MRRGSVIDAQGSTVPLDEFKEKDTVGEEIIDISKDSDKQKNNNERRSRSPKKPRSREIREEQRKATLTIKEQQALGNSGSANRTDLSSTSSENIEDAIIERSRPARSKSRAPTDSPRKRTRSPTKKLQSFKSKMDSMFVESDDDEELDDSPEIPEKLNAYLINGNENYTNSSLNKDREGAETFNLTLI